MNSLRISLFGKFQAQCDDRCLSGLEAHKVQELLCYLLLYRHQPHPRETLADLLWANTSTAQSKKHLRQLLWQLQSAFESQIESDNGSILLAEPDWIQINPHFNFWLDVAVFEEAFELTRGVAGRELDRASAGMLQQAVDLYRGDLLEGWYQEWCLYERERLQI
jgi:DNA-binding SARP family transcriptional activator